MLRNYAPIKRFRPNGREYFSPIDHFSPSEELVRYCDITEVVGHDGMLPTFGATALTFFDMGFAGDNGSPGNGTKSP